MKKVISISEIVGNVVRDRAEFEVCAVGEANYDESTSRLTIELDSFIRPVNIREREQHLPADWLPKKNSAHETVPPEETVDVAKDIFRRWVGKVRQSVPFVLHA